MNTPQLVSTALAVALAATAACSRTETQEDARKATAEVRTVVAKASHQLSDSWLTTKVQAQYFADEDIKARYINVSTRDGIVTLSGYVDSQHAREQALQIARNTDGVRQVADRLAIGVAPASVSDAAVPSTAATPVATTGSATAPEPAAAPVSARPDDAAVTSAIQARYFLDASVKSRRIDVEARDGIVTLRGEVASEDERAQALLLARTAGGVQRVEDNLTVNAAIEQTGSTAVETVHGAPDAASPPTVTATGDEDSSLAAAIRAKFAADERLKTSALEVSAKDGVVWLQGTAATSAARQRALTLARDTNGVAQLVDRISIAPRR